MLELADKYINNAFITIFHMSKNLSRGMENSFNSNKLSKEKVDCPKFKILQMILMTIRSCRRN
jgi:hypothetical protein